MGAVKKYEYAAQELRRKIGASYKPGDLFPPESLLARDLGVSVCTLRKAMEILVAEGLLIRGQGKRTTLAQPPAAQPAQARKKSVLLLPFDEGTFFHEELVKIQVELYDHGYLTSLCSSARLYDPNVVSQVRQIVQAHGDVEGLICGPLYGWYNKVAPAFEELPYPFVAIGTTTPIPTSYVAVNLASGAYEALRHLDQIGCRTIRFFGFRGHGNPFERFAGVEHFQAEFRKEESVETLTVPAFGTVASGFESAMREFTAGRVPDGILAHNDLCAIGIMLAARKLGIQIPEDIAVAGCDDIADAAKSSPPLTTVQQPKEQVAREAVRILHDAITRPETAVRNQILLQPRLVLRDSTLNYALTHNKAEPAGAAAASAPALKPAE